MSYSRRRFIKRVSTVAGLGLLAPIPPRWLWSAPPSVLVVEPDESLLREMALVAVDAARAAGADFADVRVAAGRSLLVGTSADYSQGETSPQMGRPRLDMRLEYGIRVLAGGVWGFAGGLELTRDAVAALARRAVGRARSNRRRRGTVGLARVGTGQTGTWNAPIEQDPFDVPIGEQAELAFAALSEGGSVRGVDWGSVSYRWTRNLRVFASSEGSLISQRMAVAFPTAQVGVSGTRNTIGASVVADRPRSGAYGYEAITAIDLGDELRKAGQRAVAEAALGEPIQADVGRYDIVFGPREIGRAHV